MFLISSKKFRFLYFHLPLFFSMVLFTRQDSTEFENFQSEFDKLLSKTVSIKFLFIIFLGDFYTRSLSWWKEHKTTQKVTHLEALTSLAQLSSVYIRTTHLLPHPNSCIDLTFTDQPNLVINYSTHSSFNFKCHHQIIYCKLNLNIEYHPPYQQLGQDYKKAHINSVEANKLVTFNYCDPPSMNYFLKNKIK